MPEGHSMHDVTHDRLCFILYVHSALLLIDSFFSQTTYCNIVTHKKASQTLAYNKDVRISNRLPNML